MDESHGLTVALIKLGGSVLTNKSRLRSFSETEARRLALEMKEFISRSRYHRLVLVHGGGSFGHIRAKKYNLSAGLREESQLHGFAQVRNDMRDLNSKIVSILIESGIPAISFPPETFLRVHGGRVIKSEAGLLEKCVGAGLVPVSFGDAVIDTRQSFSILSGDAVMLSMSSMVHPSISVFCTDVDGVFDSNPRLSANSRLIPRLRESDRVSTDATGTDDVTGGMGGKLKFLFEIAHNSGRTVVLNGLVPLRLRETLAGRDATSTEVVPTRRRPGKKASRRSGYI
jgi:isopentenyl phosphate kinase